MSLSLSILYMMAFGTKVVYLTEAICELNYYVIYSVREILLKKGKKRKSI